MLLEVIEENKMNIAFIPVRCGSKSIPFKNIREFCGKPLVYWSIKALQNSLSIDKIIIATDCDEIKEVVDGFNFSKAEVFNRSKENASDESSTESVMLEYILQSDLENNDLFILVQATSPLTQSEDFDCAINKLNDVNADSLLTCVREKKFIWNDDATPFNYDYLNRPRRQDFDGVLVENGAFYINTVRGIKISRNRLFGGIAIYEMDKFKSVDIDELDDWIVAEKMMRKYFL